MKLIKIKFYRKLRSVKFLRLIVVRFKQIKRSFFLHFKGYQLLDEIIAIIIYNNMNYHLSYGTLLGFIRDNGFIIHDYDIDLVIITNASNDLEIQKSVFIESLKKKYTNIEFSDSNDLSLVSFTLNKVKFDIVLSDKILDLTTLRLRNRDFNIPSNSIRILNEVYGKNWKKKIVYYWD